MKSEDPENGTPEQAESESPAAAESQTPETTSETPAAAEAPSPAAEAPSPAAADPSPAAADPSPAAESDSPDEAEDQSFAELLEASEKSEVTFTRGEQVEATVVALTGDCVFLDLGTRAEGQLSRDEILVNGEPSVAAGDILKVFVVGHREGAVRCALRLGGGADKAADLAAAVEQLREAQTAGMPVTGKVMEVIKGGFRIEVLGQRAFCPVSQIERGYCETPEHHVGEEYDFAILEIKSEGRDVVLSRRKLLEAEMQEKAAELWQTLEVGATLDGTVTSLQKYGAFVDIGGPEGLIHVSEISHERVKDPADVLSTGQSVRVLIKELDLDQKRIGLSLKALLDDPWTEAQERIRPNVALAGKIQRLAQFGAFVELLPGVEGLIHISKLSGEQRINHPRDVVNEGDEVSVRVLDVDWQRRRISLTLVDKDAEELQAATEQYQKNQSQSGSSMGTLGDLLKSKMKK